MHINYNHIKSANKAVKSSKGKFPLTTTHNVIKLLIWYIQESESLHSIVHNT